MQSKHAQSNEDLLSVSQTAYLAGVSADTIRRWEKAGRIPGHRTPTGHRRFRRGDVEALLTTEPTEATA